MNTNKQRYAITTNDPGNPALAAKCDNIKIANRVCNDLQELYDKHQPRVDVDYYAIDDGQTATMEELMPTEIVENYEY